jgi:hypothetical protein
VSERGEASAGTSRAPTVDRRSDLLFFTVSAVLVLVGLRLRLDRWPFHANVWGIDWLNYYELQARHLYNLEILGFFASWEGLHPPVSGIIHGLGMVLGIGFPIHWAGTAAASLAAPVLLATWLRSRAGMGAALILLAWSMLSAQQANYALNTSPYPWYLLFGTASTVAFAHALERGPETRDGARALVAAGVVGAIAIQTHVLAFAIVLAQAVFFAAQGPAGIERWGRAGVKAAAWIGASAAWMVAGALFKTSDPWTFHVGLTEGGPVGEAIRVLTTRFGAASDKSLILLVTAGLVVAALLGPRRKIAGLLLLEVAGILSALVLFFQIGVGDPRLSHYYVLPQLLILGVAALGIGALAGEKGGRRKWIVLLGVVALSVPWARHTLAWQQRVLLAAEAEIERSDAHAVRPFVADAGPGDVVIYLWDPTFLNDEPEHLDPITAVWPMGRFGRPCFDEEAPRMFCARHAGARFYSAPWGHWGPLDEVEEPLRIAINAAKAPGRATILISPLWDEAPPRPWPMETWLKENGAGNRDYPGGIVVWQLPPGTTIPDPPPMHPEGSE